MTKSERFASLMGSEQSDLRSRTVRAGAFAIVAEGAAFVVRLGAVVVLARLLLPEHFGLIAMITAITSIAERFKDLGLSIATVQRAEITHDQVSTLFWVNVAVGAGLVLLVAGLAWPLAVFYGDPRLVPVTLAIASSFFWSGLAAQHQILLRRRMQYGRLAMIQTASLLLSIAVAVWMALADFGYWALVAREVSSSVFMALGSWLAMPWVPGAPRRGTGVRSMIAFGGNITAFNLVVFISHNLDQIVIGRLFGAVPLGFYRQGVNLVLSPMMHLTYPFNSVAEAALSRLQSDPGRYRNYYRRIQGGLSSAAMPVAAMLAVFAEEIVLVALGARWIDAAVFVRILALAMFLRPAISTIGAVMVSCGLSRRYLWWGACGAACLIASVLIGSLWGPEGIAWAQVAATLLLIGPAAHWGLRGTPVRVVDWAAPVVRPAIASLVMAGLLASTRGELVAYAGPAAALVCGAAVGMLAYLGAWLLLPGGRAEFAELARHVTALLKNRTA